MIITGAILITAAAMVAADNLWHASWARVKTSMAMAVIGAVLIVAGMI